MNFFNEGTNSNYDSKLSCKFIKYLFVVRYTDGGFWAFSLCDWHDCGVLVCAYVLS